MILFHRHHWKVISADVTGGDISGYSVCVTLECEDCGKRQYRERGVGYKHLEDTFPSENAAKVWIDSLLPKEAREIELTTLWETKPKDK